MPVDGELGTNLSRVQACWGPGRGATPSQPRPAPAQRCRLHPASDCDPSVGVTLSTVTPVCADHCRRLSGNGGTIRCMEGRAAAARRRCAYHVTPGHIVRFLTISRATSTRVSGVVVRPFPFGASAVRQMVLADAPGPSEDAVGRSVRLPTGRIQISRSSNHRLE